MTRHISCGPVNLVYENGFVRYISVGSSEIVRLIYFALRDSSWVTAELQIGDEKIVSDDLGFSVSYRATNVVNGKPVFEWDVLITGNNTGRVDFSIDGKAVAEYTRNRAGICVLHPVKETVGRPVHVTKQDGSSYDSEFPKIIKPHQPFLDITKFEWKLENGIEASLTFEGDIFETEDQRNWSDTSFKTYSTPLSLPMPVLLKPGDRVKQRVILNVGNVKQAAVAKRDEVVHVIVDQSRTTAFPKIGFSFPGDKSVSEKSVDLLRSLQPQHLRIVVNFAEVSWLDQLTQGFKEARLIGVNVFIHLIFEGDASAELRSFLKELRPADYALITRVAVSPLDRKRKVDDILKEVVPELREMFPTAEIGAGFRSYFTELNRNRFDTSKLDFVVYALNPQVHANDDRTLVDNLAAQTDQVVSAKQLAPGRKIHVGLVSLRPPFNPDARPGTSSGAMGLPVKYDIRKVSKLTACWALASIKYLSEGGADSITLFESHGMNGYLLDANDVIHPEFPAKDKVFVVHRAIAALQALRPQEVIFTSTSSQLVVSSLLVRSGDTMHLVLSNHTLERQKVEVSGQIIDLGAADYLIVPFAL